MNQLKTIFPHGRAVGRARTSTAHDTEYKEADWEPKIIQKNYV